MRLRCRGNYRRRPCLPWTFPNLTEYLVSCRQAAPSFVPCDLGMGLPWNHTVQIQSLSFSHVGGGRLYIDRLGQSWGCKNRDGEQSRLLG